MEFSMIFEAQIAGPTPEKERQVMHDCVEQAVLAERMGFDRVWAVEHHCLHSVRAHERAGGVPLVRRRTDVTDPHRARRPRVSGEHVIPYFSGVEAAAVGM